MMDCREEAEQMMLFVILDALQLDITASKANMC
jgi:hypothetical protein